MSYFKYINLKQQHTNHLVNDLKNQNKVSQETIAKESETCLQIVMLADITPSDITSQIYSSLKWQPFPASFLTPDQKYDWHSEVILKTQQLGPQVRACADLLSPLRR